MKVLVERPISVERPARTMSGSPILFLNIATVVAVPFILIDGFRMADWPVVVGGFLVWVAMGIVWRGFFTLEPNEACVLVGWGQYHGTVREAGFHWTNPFFRKKPVSLRVQTLCIEKLKVNDKHGAPVELTATVVWRVAETARATFDVNCVADYVQHHCENAARLVAGKLSEGANGLGGGEGVGGVNGVGGSGEATRRGIGYLQSTLRHDLQERVMRAGVTIDEVRVTQRCEKWHAAQSSESLSAA
ncbi:MAG TPA: SPFH domain-containing protein [Verrucomicrobiae bacterium]|nr:SPFH domain-containing protein [Verrucomicrobiae bacterium]